MDQKTLSAAEAWQAARGELQLQLPRETFDTWLRSARLIAHEDGTYIIGVPNSQAREWLEHRLMPVVVRTLGRIAKRTVEVRFVVAPENGHTARQQAQAEISMAGPLLAALDSTAEKSPPAPPASTGLNASYTFDSFITGTCNRLACAAAQSVVETPAAQFNPLYIYAGVGLGKTHLLHAIGNSAHQRRRRVLLVAAESFTNELVAAIKGKKTAAFRERYREVDLLLVDDVQFLAGKDSSQEEFFHTFNALITANAQLVVAAATPPAEIARLDDRLRSRFEGGLVLQLQAPDMETRIEILERKARARAKSGGLPRELLEQVAEGVEGSVRELEGALNRLIATTLLTDGTPTSEQAAEALAEVQTASQSEAAADLRFEKIVAAVAQAYDVPEDELCGRSRKREVSTARQVVMYVAYSETELSLREIGEALDGRSHSTISYGCTRVEEQMTEDAKVRRQVQDVVRALHKRPEREPAKVSTYQIS